LYSCTSPTEMLASFSSGGLPHTLYLVTGDRGAGKTVWCGKFAHQAAQAGYKVVGLLSPGVFQDHTKTAIDLLDLATNERRTLSTLAQEHERAGRGEVRRLPGNGLVVGGWRMDSSVLEWADRILTRLLTTPPAEKTILMIDELGPLEFNHGLGLIAPLLLPIDEQYEAAFIVVRPELLDKAFENWLEAQLFEITPGASR